MSKFPDSTRYVVAGGNRWGQGVDLAEAKRNFTTQGGRLSGGYEVIHFAEGTTFKGVDQMGRYHFEGPAPTSEIVPPRKPRKPKF